MFFIDENINTNPKRRTNIENEKPSKIKKIKKFFSKNAKFFVLGISLIIVGIIAYGVANKIEELKYLKNHEHIYENGKCTICEDLEVYYAEFIDGDGEIIKVPYTIDTKKIEEPEAVQKIGYNSSWKKETAEDGTIKYDVVYTPIEYTVTYHIPIAGIENNPLNKTSYNIESSKTSLVSIEVEGYTFGGWYKNENYTDPVSEIDPSKLSNINLYAKFIPNKTTIVLYPNGAKESSVRLYLNANESIALNNEYFTRYGCTFIGWSESGTNDNILSDGYTYKANTEEEIVTFYAMWKENETTIIYKSNDATVDDITQVIKSSETVTLINSNFKKEASTLVGYSLTENGQIDYAIGQQYRAKENSETIYLYPVFVKNQNRIVFNPNGEVTSSMPDLYIDSLTTVSLTKNTFVKQGEVTVFVGWSTTPKGTIVYEDEAEFTASAVEETITLYAIWTQNAEITIHFNTNGGESSIELKDIVCSLNETVDIPSTGLTKTGKTFIGWSIKSDGDLMYAKKYSYNQNIVGGELTLYAVYDTNKTIIKFDSNGASGIMPDMTIMAGKQATLSENLFTKEGYTFKGWTLNRGNNIVNYYNATPFTAELDSNVITLYALFERNKTIINFNNNGGYGIISSITVESLDTVLLPSSGFSIDKMNFTGYSLVPNGELVYKVGSEFTASNENETITLYAVYEKNYNLITLNSNNGKDEKVELKVYFDEKKNLPKNTFEKECYTFVGWSYVIDGEVKLTDEELYTPTLLLEEINLYAVYRINVTELNFYFNESENQISKIYVNANEQVTLPDNIYTKTGYTFIGWIDSLTKTEIVYQDKDSFSGLKDDSIITLYPLFERNHTSISFNANGGKGTVNGLYVESMSIYELPMNLFTYAGHKFIGWSESTSGELLSEGYNLSAPTENGEIVYYAIWEENEKRLTLYYNNGTEDYEVIENFNVSSGDIITLEPTYKDYVFLGWNTNKDAETALYTSNKKFIIEPMNEYVLYAIYGEMKGTSGLVYKLSSDGTYYSITGYKGIETNVIIPTTLDEIRVKYIADYAFKDNDTIVGIELPKYCVSVGKSAFENCTSLFSVTLNENLETIYENAFKNTVIDEIVIPSSVQEIKNNAFMNSSISKVTLSSNVTTINESTFENCTNLEEINLENVVTIKNKAFYNCTKLNNITLTEVKVIDSQAFALNTGLKNITLGEKLEEIGIYAFKETVGLQTLNLPVSLKKINNGAFINSGIKSITLKENVELLGSQAFMNSSLEDLVIESTKLSYINKDTFKNSKLQRANLSSSIKKLFNGAFSDCRDLNSINLENVEDIYENVFKNCTSLSEKVYLYNIKNIKDYAFYNTSSLISVLFGTSITSVTEKAFDNSALTLIYLYDTSDVSYLSKVGLNNIKISTNPYILIMDDNVITKTEDKYYWQFDQDGNPVYSYQITVKLHGGALTGNVEHTFTETIPGTFTLTSINDITIESVTKFVVNDYLFIGWALTENGDVVYSDNESITLNISKKTYDLYAIYQLQTLDSYYSFTEIKNGSDVIGYSLTGIVNKDYIKSQETIEIPKYHNNKKVIEIGTAAFKDYQTLKNIILPDSITKINNQAFYNTGLVSLDIKENIISIEESAFEYCKDLVTANVESKYIGKNAFSGDINLTTLTLKNTIEIGEAAFKTCVNLLSFSFPSTLLYIRNEAFSSDAKLTKLTMSSSLISIGDYAFYEASYLSNITLNEGLESIGLYAFSNTTITKVSIPKTCTLVSDYAFSGSNLQIIRIENRLDDSSDKAFAGISSINQLFISKNVDYITNKFDNIEVKELYYDNSNYQEFVILDFTPNKCYWFKAEAPEAVQSNDDKFFKYDSMGLPVIYRLSVITVNYHHNGLVDTKKQPTMDKYISLMNITSLNLGYDTSDPYNEFVGWGYDAIDTAYERNERISPTVLTMDLYAVCGYVDQNYTVEPIYENEKVVSYKLVKYNGESTSIRFPDYYRDSDYSNLYIKVTKINGSKDNNILNNTVQSVAFNDFITEIPDYAFYLKNANNLNNIELTDIITTIGTEAFYNVRIDSINLEKVTTLKAKAFNNVEINTIISLKDVTSIKADSFNNCLLTVSTFKLYDFSYLKNLKVLRLVDNIVLMDTITEVPESEFYGFYNLKTITGESVVTIKNNAFRNCTSLEHAYFDNAETVEEYAFYGCASLKEIVFRENISSIGDFAFYGCTSLNKVVIDGRNSTDVVIGKYAFSNISSIKDFVTGVYNYDDESIFYHTSISNIYLLNQVTHGSAETFAFGDSVIYQYYQEAPETQVQAWNGDYDNLSPYVRDVLNISYDLQNEIGLILPGSATKNNVSGKYEITLLSTVSNNYSGYTLIGWSKSNSTRHIDYNLGETIVVHANDAGFTLYPVYAKDDNNGVIISLIDADHAAVTGFTSNSSNSYVIPNYTNDGVPITGIIQGTFNLLNEFDLTLNDFITEIGTRAFYQTNIKNLYNTDNIIEIGAWAFSETSSLNSLTFKNVYNIKDGAFNTAMKASTTLVFETPIKSFESMDFFNCKGLLTLTTGFTGNERTDGTVDYLITGAIIDKLIVGEEYEKDELDLDASTINTVIVKSNHVKTFKDQSVYNGITNIVLGKNMTISANVFVGSSNNSVTLSNKPYIYFTEDRQQYLNTPGLNYTNCTFRFMSDDANVNSVYDIYGSDFVKRAIDWTYRYADSIWDYSPFRSVYVIGSNHRLLTLREATGSDARSSGAEIFTCWNPTGFSTGNDKLNKCYCQFIPNTVINNTIMLNDYTIMNLSYDYIRNYNNHIIYICSQYENLDDVFETELNSDQTGLLIKSIYNGVLDSKALCIPKTLYCDSLKKDMPVVGISQSIISSKVQSLYIPDWITVISDYAFSGCPNLSRVSIDTELTAIPVGMFKNCPIDEFYIHYPEKVTTISKESFSNANYISLSKFTNLSLIGNMAFNKLAISEEIVLGDMQSTANFKQSLIENVTFTGKISSGCILQCTNLKKVTVKSTANLQGYYFGAINCVDFYFEKDMSLLNYQIFDGGYITNLYLDELSTKLNDSLSFSKITNNKLVTATIYNIYYKGSLDDMLLKIDINSNALKDTTFYYLDNDVFVKYERPELFKVTYVDVNNEVLYEEIVNKGSNLVYPYIQPFNYDDTYVYQFIGWDKSTNNIKEDLIVKPITLKVLRSENGEYPTSLVTDNSLIAELDQITTLDENGYKAYAGEKYLAYDGGTYVDNNGNKVLAGVHYYKVEPIRWRFLSTTKDTESGEVTELFVVSEYIIDWKPYNTNNSQTRADYQGNTATETIYTNNYKYSTIRSWLNTEFLNKVFASSDHIKVSEVYNGDTTTNPYASETTNDKIFLLDNSTLYNSAYFYDTEKVKGRYTTTTEYARAVFTKTGILVLEDSYMTRTAYEKGENHAYHIAKATNTVIWYGTGDSKGVRPALSFIVSSVD